MAQILVTGASGFVGAHVSRELVQRGHEVTVSGRQAHRLAEFAGLAKVHVADLLSAPLDELLQGVEAVVHCAARSSPWGRRQAFQRDNVEALERLVAASLRHGVRRFVHLSSPSIYFRFADQRQIGEDFSPPKQWITAYAESKWQGETVIRAAHQQGLPSIILRPRAVIGPGDNAIFPRIIRLARRGWFPLIASGRATIDVTCVENLVHAVINSLDAPASACGRAYNISNAEPQTVEELLRKVFAALHMKVRMRSVPRGVALAIAGVLESVCRRLPGMPEPPLTPYSVGVIAFDQTLDIGAARRHLAYDPSVSVDQGIERFARWWSEHAD